MKIKLLSVVRGQDFEGKPGDVVEVPEASGGDLVASHQAVVFEDAPEETAARPTRKSLAVMK